ncbi:alginate export family protein [Flavobacterium sp. ZS1P14]|uniref:alginate export family protein n=1 Tax=Flavobacterium sp. ZS1P14 TaxID=3401729 RepID=UPI003AB0A088
MKNSNHLIYKITLVFVMAVTTTIAQNKISILRYDDDFSLVKKDSLKKGLNQLKYIPLGANNYISFGGELREQFQVYDNINFGDVPPTYQDISTNQLWHRLMVHSNIELGNHFRFFIQLNNTLRFLNDNPVVPEFDENQLSLHQAFAEIKLKSWDFRVGRQELLYGNNRLITVREGPNTRLTFDGLVIKKVLKNGKIDFFAVSKVVSKQYAFDDESFKEGLIGIYGTHYFSNRTIGLDYFAVNFQSKLRKYNYHTGFENRQTYGIRLFSNYKKINFEAEGGYQSGTFNNLTISAYTALADVNLMLLPSKKGIIGFAANAASGDKNSTDNKLNTYNLTYARPAYGLAVPIGASNIISVYPYIKINPVQKLNVLAQLFFMARNSNQDGTYSPGMIENRPKPTMLFSSSKKTLGEYYVLETNYQQTKNLSFSFDASYFKAGSYPKATGKGKDVSYVSFKSTFKF